MLYRSKPHAIYAVLLMIAALAVAYFHSRTQEPAQPISTIPADAVLAPPAEEQPAEEVEEAPERELSWQEGRFGRTPFYAQMADIGLSGPRVHQLIDALTPVYDFRRAQADHRWRVGFDGDEPVAMSLVVSPAEIYDVTDLDQTPQVARRPIETFTLETLVEAQIQGSLFQALNQQPQTAKLIAKIENVFAWDIDFYTDPRKGDQVALLIEKTYIDMDGEPVFYDYGDILAARYDGSESSAEAFRYEADGDSGYYNAKGQNLQRAFLRAPLKLTRVTSAYNKRRFHPILKRHKPHNGVDYGAARGTPVFAVADGRVVRASRWGGAGHAVVIDHAREIRTQYFHLNGYAKGIRKGVRVKQGQVIGYVGKTGLATSYHLHFGMKVRGKYVNPQKQRYEPGNPIPKRHLDDFEQVKNQLLARFGEPSADLIFAKKPVYPKQLKPKSI